MTPTLHGRWQTRFLLLSTLGLVITLIVGLLLGDLINPFLLLCYTLLFGLGWDLLYSFLQLLRWDRDWPPLFGWLAGLWEGMFLFLLTQISAPVLLTALPGTQLLPGVAQVTLGAFWFHYGLVFAAVFLASLGLLHIMMPEWRYRGGEWLSEWEWG